MQDFTDCFAQLIATIVAVTRRLGLTRGLGLTRWLGFAIPASRVLGFAIPLLLLTSCDAGRHERMQQELAALQAMNQADSILTDDSLAQTLADYFDRHGTPNEQMEAHYLLGRTHADRGEAPAALAAYHDAIDRADTTAKDCNYRQLCRVYSQMAKIFYQQNLLKEDLECLEQYIIYAWKGKDTLCAINAYAHKIPAFERLQMYDSIIHVGDILYKEFYKKGFEKNVSRYFAAVIPSLLNKGMKQKAKFFIDIYEHESGYFDSLGNIEHGREAFYNNKGRYFEAINRFDSAEYYFRKEFMFGKDYINQNMSSRELSCLFRKLNMPDSAAKYALYSYEMNDSVYAQMATAEVEKAHNTYNYMRHKELAVHEKERADREHSRFLYLVILFICSSTLFLFIVWKKKKKRETERKEYEENKTMLNKLQEEKNSLQALATNYLNQKIELEESLEDLRNHEQELDDQVSSKENIISKQKLQMELFKANVSKLNVIISKKEKEIQQLEDKIYLYNQSMHIAKDTVEMHYKNSDLHKDLDFKLKRGLKLSDKDLENLDSFAQEYMPRLYTFLMSNGMTDEKKYRTCYLFRLHLSVKDVSNLLGVSPPYISQISKDMVNSLFFDTGSSKELKKEIEKFDMNIRNSST